MHKKISSKRREIGNSVQVGLPEDRHWDVYFYFMHWNWAQIFGLFSLAYLGINLFFGLLYWLQPDCISNVNSNSFVDLFFFSVQTLATIGYGSMVPQTLYAHTIVTIEAATGMLGIAVVSGIMFARLSRPTAKVLFSEPVVITRLNGIPRLCFRVANARGNDLVQATVGVVMMVEDNNQEGHRLRRLIDLKLDRTQTPFFRMSWTVMHRIDESSPLFQSDLTQLDKHLLGFVVSIMGHDGTYGQTIYARHIYYPENIHCAHRFADVLSDLPDGRFMIDYSRFHEAIPENTAEIEFYRDLSKRS